LKELNESAKEDSENAITDESEISKIFPLGANHI
jgi:hypothetical protein